MKNLKTLALSIAVCLLSFSTQAQWDSIKGSKDVVTKDRSIKNFSRVKAGGSVNVYLKKGNSVGITVEADDNLHEYIETRVSGGMLEISTEKNFRSYEALNIYVTFTDLEEIDAGGATDVYLESEVDAKEFELSVGGSADFEGSRPINAEIFKIYISGSADAEMEVYSKEMDIEVRGSADLEIEGSTEKLELDASGSADFLGSDFKAKTCNAYTSGSSDAHVHVTGSLSVSASGSSDLYYRGNPDIERMKTSGSADVSRQ